MYAFAPSAAAVLSDWGADVVKVVPPTVADPMMGAPISGLAPREDGIAFMWEIMNRGKQSVGIDVSTEGGRGIVLELVAEADVFVTNLLSGARTRFRLDPDDLRDVNPRLIYARATGHGNRGPEREQGGFDHTDFWARTGIAHAASMVSGEFVPQAGPALGDLSAGAFLAGAIAAALFRRERTGKGGIVDVSLLSSGMWAFSPGVVASQMYDIDTIPRRPHIEQPNPLVAGYTTRDGRMIYFAGIQTERHFEHFCERIGASELLEDSRFTTGQARLSNARECIEALDAVFARRDLAEWLERLEGLDTPWTLVQTAREAANDPQVTANEFVTMVRGPSAEYPLVRSPAQFDDELPTLTRAPDHGEHTDEVLLAIGHDWEEILRLKETGAVL
jgi:crotonobetainyl-CoA:carnitine CoA-transferase CaiB-like acyl-CoA transferase